MSKNVKFSQNFASLERQKANIWSKTLKLASLQTNLKAMSKNDKFSKKMPIFEKLDPRQFSILHH